MADKNTLSELDNLLAELNSDIAPAKPTTTQKPQERKSQKLDELEQLVISLQTLSPPQNLTTKQSSSTISKPAPTPSNNPPPIKPLSTSNNSTNAPGTIPSMSRRQTVVLPKPTSVSNVCAKCTRPITEDVVVALGKSWHVSCLICTQCSNVIQGDFYEHQGGSFCKTCMASKITCSKCAEPITRDYLIGDGKIYHPHCVEVPTCAKCSKSIEATQLKLSALNKHYHKECFVCTSCSTELSLNFFQKDNLPYCENCSRKSISETGGNCSTCGFSIEGNIQFVKFGNFAYHQQCFVCQTCKTTLEVSGFYSVGGKPTCGNCVSKQK